MIEDFIGCQTFIEWDMGPIKTIKVETGPDLISQQTFHSSPSRASYGVSLVSVCRKHWSCCNQTQVYFVCQTMKRPDTGPLKSPEIRASDPWRGPQFVWYSGSQEANAWPGSPRQRHVWLVHLARSKGNVNIAAIVADWSRGGSQGGRLQSSPSPCTAF